MNGDTKKKISLLGDPAVGKTSLVRRFAKNMFDDRYITTVGSKVIKKRITFENGENLTMMIWDISGQDKMASIKSMYYKGTNGALVVCDLTRPDTLESLDRRLKSVFSVAGNVPVIFIGNKADLESERKIDREVLEAKAAEYGAQVFLTSAKTGENVELVFERLGKLLMEE